MTDTMTDQQIKHMVNRFLGWRLPENFNPDAGISFEKTGNTGTPYQYNHNPTGTNLFDADQATAMVRYMVEGMPSRAIPAETMGEEVAAIIEMVIRDVAELPDRTSPDYDGDMMLVTAPELSIILEHALARLSSRLAAVERERDEAVAALETCSGALVAYFTNPTMREGWDDPEAYDAYMTAKKITARHADRQRQGDANG